VASACGMWQVAGSGWRAAEIMTPVYIFDCVLSLVRPPRRNLTMRNDHAVDNCSFRFCKNGRQLDLGESRSTTQIFKCNLLLASHGLWAYVCAVEPGLMMMMAMVMMAMVMMAMVMMAMVMMAMVMMAMVMTAMVMVLVMVPETLRQVGWLRQR